MTNAMQIGTTDLRRAFGCTIASDIELSGFPAASGTQETAIVRILSSGRSWNGSNDLSEALPFVRELCPQGVRYLAKDIGEFIVEEGGRIVYSLAPGAASGDVQHVLTGPALLMALQLQGRFFLHAGAIERRGSMFALAAPHGFGKSTLTASFLDVGCAVHSDDVVPIRLNNDLVLARQGQPWIKLWDSALEVFGRDPAGFDPVVVGYAKRVVPAVTADCEIPLRCIYVLRPHLIEQEPVKFHPMARLDGALVLMGNAYSPETIRGELAARSLDLVTQIAERVPVRIVSYYRSFENLPAIRQAILSDFDALHD